MDRKNASILAQEWASQFDIEGQPHETVPDAAGRARAAMRRHVEVLVPGAASAAVLADDARVPQVSALRGHSLLLLSLSGFVESNGESVAEVEARQVTLTPERAQLSVHASLQWGFGTHWRNGRWR